MSVTYDESHKVTSTSYFFFAEFFMTILCHVIIEFRMWHQNLLFVVYSQNVRNFEQKKILYERIIIFIR